MRFWKRLRADFAAGRHELGLARWLFGWTLILLGIAVLVFDFYSAFTSRSYEGGWYQDTDWPPWIFLGGGACCFLGYSILSRAPWTK